MLRVVWLPSCKEGNLIKLTKEPAKASDLRRRYAADAIPKYAVHKPQGCTS
jgi:hypothetical protein